MQTRLFPGKQQQDGFSLPEIMVGMVIGLLGIIIIMQVTSVFEGQKRTTTSGDDAQNGAVIAMYTLQRDITQSGYGISSTNLLSAGGVQRTFVTPFVNFAAFAATMINPVLVTASGQTITHDPETDFLVVVYGNSTNTSAGSVIRNSSPVTYTMATTSAVGVAGTLSGGHGFNDQDWVTVDDGNGNGGIANTHYMYQVSGVSSGSVPVVMPATYNSNYSPPYPPPALQYNATATVYPTMFDLGPGPTIVVYAVRSGSLSVCNFMSYDCTNANAVWTPLTSNIVSMHAECMGGFAVRVALVSRNNQPSGTSVSTVPTWNPNGIPASVATLATTLSNWTGTASVPWNQYRYKTVEAVIPLRNTVWSGAQGC